MALVSLYEKEALPWMIWTWSKVPDSAFNMNDGLNAMKNGSMLQSGWYEQ